MIKPYRLVNAFELKEMSLRCIDVLHHWNNTYSVEPVSLQLSLPPKDYAFEESFVIYNNEAPLASIGTEYIGLINHALFGVNKPCFNASSQALCFILLNQLFKTEQCTISHTTSDIQDWFYAGSTSLLLTLSTSTHTVPLILNPDWVYQNLPAIQNMNKQLSSLDDVIAEEVLDLNVILETVTLSLEQFIHLKPGELLITDHSINTPMKVTQQQAFIAHAALGQSLHYKSIWLKRSL